MKKTILALVAGLMLTAQPVAAEDFPSQAIRIIVPHGAGGSTDLMTRLVAEPFSKNLGQGVAVANIPGGGTAIGAQEAARSKPDGYTLALTHVALLTSSAMGANKMGPESLAPVAQLGSETQLVAVPADSDIDSLEAFYKAASADGAPQLKLGVSPGAANHFAFLRMLQPVGKTDVIFVPTGGGGPSMQELLGKHIDVGTFVVSESIDQIKAGNIRALAVFSRERHPDLPDVPTAREAGYDIDIGLDYVLYAPKDTPQDRVDILANAMEKTIADPEFQELMLSRSVVPAFEKGTVLNEMLDKRWSDIKELAAQIQK